MSSSKMTKMLEKPSIEEERTVRTPGIPRSAVVRG
jgi:hypothetical protein